MRATEFVTENFADGQDKISFKVQKGKNKFATTLTVNNTPAGVYQYNADTGRSIAEIIPEFQSQGLGKILVLHAIYTAAQLGMDFQEDESRTAAYNRVLDSLSSSGYIVDDDGYWYVTGEGEQFLNTSLNENFAKGSSNDMSIEDMIAYLRQHHDKNLHPDYLDHLTNTNSKFVLKQIPLGSIRTELSGLDQAKVEQYKKMDFSKAPPIVVGSDGNILDGYHRATVAKALGITAIRAYVGVKNQNSVSENFADGKKPGRKGLSRRVGIPKKATLGQLEKIAKNSTGERRKMAQWQLNMRRGKAKNK